MKETDELRRVAAKTECANGRCEKLYRGDLERIADRIDAEHERQTSGEYLRGVNDGYDQGFASADDWLGQHEDAMAEHGWIRLPLDADGVPTRIGDEVDSDHYEDGTVIGIQYFKAPNGVVFEEIAVQPNGWDTATWRDPDEYRHHHAPTVEDVLREFADRVCSSGHQWGLDAADTIAKYAAKLRLAEESDTL